MVGNGQSPFGRALARLHQLALIHPSRAATSMNMRGKAGHRG